jgi:hypothetical protein
LNSAEAFVMAINFEKNNGNNKRKTLKRVMGIIKERLKYVF